MNGGLSQVDSFDPKPMLDKYHGQPLPGGEVATERKTGRLMRSPFTFKKYGQSGIEVSELFPHVGGCADDICFIRSMYTDIPNHEPSMLMMNTGHTQVGRPSLGSWLTYGLGTENKNLPGYVVLCPDVPTTVGPPLWNSAFLPAVHQGTFISDKVEKQDETSSSARTSIRRSSSRTSTTRSSRCRSSGASSTCWRSSIGCGAAPTRGATRSSRPRSSRWKWPTGCRPRRPTSSTSARRAQATLKLYGPAARRAAA